MIRYQLTCGNGDAFEAWFRNSGDFDAQAERGQIGCPLCGDPHITKAPMAPAIVKSRGKTVEAETPRAQAMTMAHKLREHVRDHFDYVGERFPEEARAPATSSRSRSAISSAGLSCSILPTTSPHGPTTIE